MTDIPDISGYKLKDAGLILRKSGISIKNIVITSPPKKEYTEYDEEFRVLRIRGFFDDGAEILVCR